MCVRIPSTLALVLAACALVACAVESSRTGQIPTISNASSGFSSDVGAAKRGAGFVPDRIVVIVMENHSFDDIVGATDKSGYHLLTPFLTQTAQTGRLATLAFGIAHPSLPNYLSLIAGDYFGVHDDNGSCFAPHRPKGCHSFDKKNLVDSLEAAGISWASYNESMPSDGYLQQQYPKKGDGLYRQKHDPFVYFKDIATDPKRLSNVKTFVDLKKTLNNGLLPRFSFIVPDECHDMHGSVGFCPGPTAALIEAGDSAVQKLVQAIIGSGSFTAHSLIFITWDEGDNNLGCCDAPPVQSGGHIPLMLISGVPGAVRSDRLYNHYSLLSTIETLWNLPKLGYTADTDKVKPMLDLIPSR
jgi:phospholipase C